MTMQTAQYRTGKSIGAGIAGGIAGGAAMYGIMSAIMTSIGMGPNCFAIIMGMITGQPYAAAIGPGIAAHFGTSIAIGAIFGVIVSTRKLQLSGFPKGIGLGIATGVIAYSVIFLPISMTVMPSHMMDLMKMMSMGNMGGNMHQGTMNGQSSMGSNSVNEPQGKRMSNSSEMNQQGAMGGGSMQGGSMGEKSSMQGSSMNQSAMNEKYSMDSNSMGSSSMNQQSSMGSNSNMEAMNKMMMEQMNKIIPSILGGALAGHIVFGAVLGVVATAIVRVSRK